MNAHPTKIIRTYCRVVIDDDPYLIFAYAIPTMNKSIATILVLLYFGGFQ